MRRVAAILGSAIFLVIAPGFVAGLVPYWISLWQFADSLFGIAATRYLGWILLALGSIGLFDCFARFAIQGLGTPAPVFPTKHLVITGLYRYVRNPMYVGVVSTILGQGLILGSLRILEYGAIVWALFFAFVLLYEEPRLRRTFGAEYEAFCAEVPRWIPRLKPAHK